MSSRSIRISGHVQGVFFRAETQQMARELKLTGWVRNNDNGTVQIHAEGDEASLKELEEWCNHGPSGAQVDSVICVDANDEGCESFEIRHD